MRRPRLVRVEPPLARRATETGVDRLPTARPVRDPGRPPDRTPLPLGPPSRRREGSPTIGDTADRAHRPGRPAVVAGVGSAAATATGFAGESAAGLDSRGIHPTGYRSRPPGRCACSPASGAAEDTNCQLPPAARGGPDRPRSPTTCRDLHGYDTDDPGRRRASSGPVASRSRASPTWRSCSTACRSSESPPR